MSQYLNALNGQMGKTLSCNALSFMKFFAYIITHLFLTVFVLMLV